jgi:hypothetical protein
MLESLITSKTRIKLLLKFFLNSSTTAHLRGLESEFGESTNGIRLELNRFEQAGLLSSHTEGNRKVYSANTKHPLFIDIQHLVHKHIGLDQLIEKVILRLGKIEKVYLTGAFAHGQESNEIELLIITNNIDQDYLDRLVKKVSRMIRRTVLYVVRSNEESNSQERTKQKDKFLLLWQNNNKD